MTKKFKNLLIILIAIILSAITALLWYRHASQPQINGTITLTGPGSTIDIVRDAEGIPHIYAQSATDAYFALGFVHAQDRLWQMDLDRRITQGRIAEILGKSALNTDKFLRTLGITRNAQKILPNLPPETLAVLEAYAKGVNAYLANRSGPLPPEFILTGAPAPAPWSPVDSISWQTMMAWDLGSNWSGELMRMRLAQHLSLAQINDILPPYPGDAVQQTQDYTKLYRGLADVTQQLSTVASIAPSSYIDGMGSNEWVVSGDLSETGKPLLANDPHLGLSAPSLWYFAHMSAPGLHVIGATLPGLPSVILGHNDHIAWGFTNTGSDVQDLYIEHINPNDAKQYQTPDGWAEFATRTEVIKVKDQADVTMAVRETRHGPVISGALDSHNKLGLNAQQYAIAFQWTALRPDDTSMQAGIAFNKAENWQEFVNGAKYFAAPQQNIAYADIEGNIGYIAPGHIPMRKADNDLHGLAPAPGWDSRYDWDGFIPFDALPQQFNPASHRIITANQKIVDTNYPYFLTSEWTLPYRANRIAQLLDAKPKHTMDSFAAIQKDDISLAAQELLPVMTAIHPQSDRAKTALAKLASWHGEMDTNRAEPLIFNAWLREASYQIFVDKLGKPLMQDYWEQRSLQSVLVNVLKNIHGEAAWCIEAGKSGHASCEEVLSTSLETALSDLEKQYGSDMSNWHWGDAHLARAEHRPFSKVFWLAPFFDIDTPSPGDAFTIDVGKYNLSDDKEPFVNHHAASLRALYDLSNLENSRFIHSTGQSGNVFSPLYSNYTQRWVDVAYLPMKTTRATVENGALGTLTLQPHP